MQDEVIKRALEVGERAMAEWTQGSALPGMWNKEASAAAIAAFHEDMAANSTGLKRTHHKEIAAAIRARGGEVSGR